MKVIPQPDRILLRRQIKKFSHYIKGVVLDVGAGGFKRYDDLLKFDKYITLDINPENKPDILASADNISLEDGSVDSIICTGVLGDIENFFVAIQEFYRVLRPGGVILMTEYLICELHDEPYDFWRFTNFSLEKIFQKNNFKIIIIDERGGFFSTLLQLQLRYLIDRFNLYSHWWTKFLNPCFKLCCHLAIFFDKIDKSRANRKQVLGWCVVVKK